MGLCIRVICLVLLLTQSCISIRMGWIFGYSDPAIVPETAGKNGASIDSSALLAKIPFELQTVDEKFLQEAEKFTGLRLSELDSCHHKIIFGLRKSCTELTEEEISKLSVNLLNCQSYVEGRYIYPCTHGMSIKECTKDMDKDTWNAYHIVSNRARAVCYGTRQTLFRAKAEMTVNRLVASTEEQLHAMTSLQVDQEKLGRVTSETLDSVSGGHRHLMQQQEMLKAAQQSMQHRVAGNIRELAREKTLIAVGQKNLEDLTLTIKEKLEEANVHLSEHGESYKKSQEEILLDLSRMHEKANEVWNKIDNSTQKILAQHWHTSKHYDETLERLHRVNESITYLLLLVENTRAEVDTKLQWLSELAGGSGDKLTVLLCVTLHLGFFLLAAIGAAFVQAPFITRFSLMVIVPLNCVTEINGGQSLGFSALAAVIVVTTILHLIIKLVWSCLNCKRSVDNGQSYLPCSQPSFGLNSLTANGHAQNNKFSPPRNPAEYSDSSEEELSTTPEMDNAWTSSVLQSVMSSVRKSFKSSFAGDVLNDTIEEQDEEDEDDEDYIPPNISTKTILTSPSENDVATTRRNLMDSISYSPRLTRRSSSRGTTPIRSDSPSERPLCKSSNLKGQRCRIHCLLGKDYCHVHIDAAK